MKVINNPAEELEAIFWDFDGVLLASNEIRDRGFTEVLKGFPEDEVQKLIDFHRANGGLSRYVKLTYFFENIRNDKATDYKVKQFASSFSLVMRELLIDPQLLIMETIAYIKKWNQKIPMFIVSGSDQEELRFLCNVHSINSYFKRIHGSPRPKDEWIRRILQEEKLNPQKCVLIGDSINDFSAAKKNKIWFMGYNNTQIENKSSVKLDLN